MTPSVIGFMNELVDECQKRLGSLEGKSVLDIGCNDGSLLSIFKNLRCKTFGVDPTDAAKEAREQGHTIRQAFFTPELARQLKSEGLDPDIITFTNVFADIEDLAGLLEALKILMKESTVLIIENQYMGAIIGKSQFDTFYHEHPRTYSVESFRYISDSLGLSLLDAQFPERYGGNIRAWIGSPVIYNVNSINNKSEEGFGDALIAMNIEINKWKTRTSGLIKDLVRKNNGPIPAKAFPGRAAILLKILDLDEDSIFAVYEIKGSIKVNHYVPRTRIPILPESMLYQSGFQGSIINLAWHIADEVRQNLASNGFTGEVIDIK